MWDFILVASFIFSLCMILVGTLGLAVSSFILYFIIG